MVDLVIGVVGLVAGWLAGMVVKGKGQGLVVDLVVGVVGAVFGGWLFDVLGIRLGAGMVGAVITALIGAIVLLGLLKLIKK